MKKIIRIALSILLLSIHSIHANPCLEAAMEEMNDNYRTGRGCEDGIFTAVSSSMVAWGVGLIAGIALLTGLIHQSHAETTTTSTNTNH